MKCIVLLFILTTTAPAQNAPNNQAETSGICSPVIQSTQGKVQFTCNTAMNEATRKKFVLLLNSILSNTNDVKTINIKLDQILDFLTRVQSNNIVQGSGSIAQVGGIGNSATVINEKPLARRIVNQQAIIECLRAKPGKFTIRAIMNNGEAYTYATDWHDVLTAAGWEITHKDTPVEIIMIAAGMWSGTRIDMHAIVDGTDQLLDGSPEKNFFHCLNTTPIGAKLQLISDSKASSGVIDITVSDHD